MYLSDMWLYYFKKDNWVWDGLTLRQIVSKESWLLQFVCDNGMVKHKNEVYHKCYIWEYEDADDYETFSKLEYRLIESALCDEDKLEKFLLENIKVE